MIHGGVRWTCTPPRARWRTGSQCRENLFDLRAPYRPDQARQGAHARRVRPQGVLAAKGLITQYEVLKGTLRTTFMWRRRSSATAALSAVRRNSTVPIAASSVS